MASIKHYGTVEAAEQEIAGFMGWDNPHVVEIETVDGTAYAIEIGPAEGDDSYDPEMAKYYRVDGFVR